MSSLLTPDVGFRRGWASYEAIYLFAKFSALLIVAVIDPNNCLFRTLNSRHVLVIRQTVLLIGTIIFFAMQCFLTPFLDPIGNASEWMSRLNYVLTTILALLVALDVPGQNIYDGPVLYAYVDIMRGYTCLILPHQSLLYHLRIYRL